MTFDEKAGCVDVQTVVNKQGSYEHNEHEDVFFLQVHPWSGVFRNL